MSPVDLSMIPLSVSEISALGGFCYVHVQQQEWGILVVGYEAKHEQNITCLRGKVDPRAKWQTVVMMRRRTGTRWTTK